MKLTRRGQDAVALLVLVIIGVALLAVAKVGQDWKRDRIEQIVEQEVSQDEVG